MSSGKADLRLEKPTAIWQLSKWNFQTSNTSIFTHLDLVMGLFIGHWQNLILLGLVGGGGGGF